MRLIARRSPSASPGPEAGEGFGDLHHLVLEDDRAERLAQHRLERGVLVGDLVGGVFAQALAALDVGVDRAALDRPRAHDRHLDREVLEVPGRVRSSDCICARLSIWKTPTVSAARIALKVAGVVEGDAREVDALAAHALDLLHAALDRREHPQAEQVDLQEAGVGAGVLVPLDHLAALHRRGHHRAAVDQRPGGDDHPAGVLGEVARQAVGLLDQARQPAPAQRGLAGTAGSARRRTRARRPLRSRAARRPSAEA